MRDDNNYRQKVGELAERICGNNPNTDYKTIRDMLDDWFNDISYSISVLGEYVNSHKTIILYTKNIENNKIVGRTNAQAFESTFSHELFHAYHYKNNPKELFLRFDYTSKVCKESLAAAFEWYYCTYFNIPGTDELKHSWENYSVFTYPYAGANYLLNHDWRTGKESIDIIKFKEVFNKSIDDMDGAIRLLLPKNDFYDIKNMIYIRNIKKPAGSSPLSSKVRCFKLTQRQHFAEEIKEGYAFAPDSPRYATMRNIHKGDFCFCIYDGKLWAIEIATSDNYYSMDSHNRKEAGIYVDVDYFVFADPINVKQFKDIPYYSIERHDPYVKVLECPEFIHLILDEARKKSPGLSALFSMILRNV